MGVQFLIFFRIQKETVDLFDVMTIMIGINGEREHVLYHNGHSVNADVAYTFVGPILHRMHSLFKATIQDYTCSHSIESIQ
jgi:hypothetical protein